MFFLNEFCYKFDVVHLEDSGHRVKGGRIAIVGHQHCALSSSILNLILLQGWSRTKGGLDTPKTLQVVICGRPLNYEVLQALQLGIRHFCGEHLALSMKDLSPLDFQSTQGNWIQFSKQYLKGLPQNPVSDFHWKDYCPAVFRHLQELRNISRADYMLSVCGRETLLEVSSSGKSGSLLFKSKDNRFVIKTLRKSEVKFLCDMLLSYLRHVKQYSDSLLIKLYGVHAVKPVGGVKVYFVVMANVLRSDLYMHRSYDLKGSSQGRSLSKIRDHDGATFKDLDLHYIFYLKPLIRRQLLLQIKCDCEFLEALGIMDYSLLLGVHIGGCRQGTLNHSADFDDSFQGHKDFDWVSSDVCPNSDSACSKFGVRMPARAIRISKNRKDGITLSQEGLLGEHCEASLYLGIIDILQGYNMRKRLEHTYKSIHYKPDTFSAVNPKLYSSRFQLFLRSVFQEEEGF